MNHHCIAHKIGDNSKQCAKREGGSWPGSDLLPHPLPSHRSPLSLSGSLSLLSSSYYIIIIILSPTFHQPHHSLFMLSSLSLSSYYHYHCHYILPPPPRQSLPSLLRSLSLLSLLHSVQSAFCYKAVKAVFKLLKSSFVWWCYIHLW